MKKESNLIDTKDEIIKNFTEEQMRIYEYYKNQFSYSNKELYPIIEKDKEILTLEKSYKVLKTILKFETVLVLIIATIMFFNGFSKNNSLVKYKNAMFNVTSFNDKA